jgi:hypothetical protein
MQSLYGYISPFLQNNGFFYSNVTGTEDIEIVVSFIQVTRTEDIKIVVSFIQQSLFPQF